MTHLNHKIKSSLVYMLVIMLILSSWRCKSSKSFDGIKWDTPQKPIDRFVLTYENPKTNFRLYVPVTKRFIEQTTHIKTHSFYAKSKNGDLLREFTKDTDSTYIFHFIAGNPLVCINSTIKFCYQSYGLVKIAPYGLRLNASIGDVFHTGIISGSFILSGRADWKNKGVSYIFNHLDPYKNLRSRAMYVHNIGFIWEEIHFQGKVHRWELLEIDGIPLMEYLDTHPDFSFFD